MCVENNMPTVRAEPHIPTRYNGVAPAQIGDALFNQPDMTTSQSASDGEEKPITYSGEARLIGAWYADVETIGLKHILRFERDGSGSLRTLCQVKDEDCKFLPFHYVFDPEHQSVAFSFIAKVDATLDLLSPVLQATYHDATSTPTSTTSTTSVLQLSARSLKDVVLKDPTSRQMLYKPTEKLIFSASPWLSGLFPDANTFYGRFSSIYVPSRPQQ